VVGIFTEGQFFGEGCLGGANYAPPQAMQWKRAWSLRSQRAPCL
jgi:hypothetical protein